MAKKPVLDTVVDPEEKRCLCEDTTPVPAKEVQELVNMELRACVNTRLIDSLLCIRESLVKTPGTSGPETKVLLSEVENKISEFVKALSPIEG